jgi:argininosuccinate lyase
VVVGAGEMEKRVIRELCEILDPDDHDLLVVLTDTRSHLKDLFENNPELVDVFTSRFEEEHYTAAELLAFARDYVESQDCVMDREAELTVMTKIDEILKDSSEDAHQRTEKMLESAVMKADSAKRRLFRSRYDREGRLIIREDAFE